MSRSIRHNSERPSDADTSQTETIKSAMLYEQQVVRDLHWLIYSPALMSAASESCDWLFNTPMIDQRLAELDQKPQPLITGLRQQAQFRLGYYFEDLVRIYINIFIQPVDFKYNIQVLRDKTTVGEYDFLMALKNGIKIHLEAAVKFYLCTSEDPQHCTLDDFVGPNRSDRLSRKWQRLTQHQLQLSKTDSGKAQAMALGLLPDHHSLLLRGYLFYPFSAWQDYHPPAPINANHLRGWWISVTEVESLGADYQYVILMKPRWLALARCCFQETLSCAELIDSRSNITTPVLVARLILDKKSGAWCECDRGFIVPDSWNEQT